MFNSKLKIQNQKLPPPTNHEPPTTTPQSAFACNHGLRRNKLSANYQPLTKLPRISVVTPVKNGEKFIRQTVESVLSQKGDFELEYIVRDGCSTDKTLKILRGYGNKIIVVSKKDGSPQEAINAGMAMATGDIGCWLNADDIFLPGTLQKIVETFKKHPKQSWLYGKCNIIDENNNEIRKPITIYKSCIGYFFSKNILYCENFINQPATFWKMDLWGQICPLSTKYKAAWDYELWLKMAQLSPAYHLRNYLASFRRCEGTISETHFEKQFNEELEISRKYGNIINYLIHIVLIKIRLLLYRFMSK